MSGRVLEYKPDFIIAATYDVFCVKIEGSEVRVTPGDEIKYTFQNYSLAGNLAIISGSDPVLIKNRELTNGLMDTTDDEGLEQAGMSNSQNETSFSSFLVPNPPSTPKSTSSQKKPSTPKSSSSPKNPSTPPTPAADLPSSKRKPSSDSEANTDNRKKLKSSVEDKFGNLSKIIPLPVNTELEDSSMTPAVGLPDGWLRKKHKTEKSSWYTFVSPAGKTFKNIKSAKAFIEGSANGNSSTTAVPAKQAEIIEEGEIKGEKDRVKKIIKSVQATPKAGREEEDTELVEEDEKDTLQDDEEVGSNGIEAAQMSESMFGDDDQECGQEITEEMRISLLDNIQSKLHKSKKKKKKKNKENESGF